MGGPPARTETRSSDLNDAIRGLISWFDDTGLAGYDPYDVYDRRTVKLVRQLEGTRWQRLWLNTHSLIQRKPQAARAILRQRPHVNSKAVGLLLGSWVRLNKAGFPGWPTDADELIVWLKANAHSDYPGASWSYPWGYQSRVYFPPGTPWGIVTAICGEALLDYDEALGNGTARALARDAAVFIAEAIPLVRAGQGAYLTYTPIDDFAIHNASLSMAAFLARASQRFEVPKWGDIAEACLEFTLSEQLPDGAFDYWASHQSTWRHVDNYHTGFVLRALQQFRNLGYQSAEEPLNRGWTFYTRVFEGEDGRPRTMECQDLPIDIHGCAESILCGAVLAMDGLSGALDLAWRAFHWTNTHLRNSDGSFGYGLFDYGVQTMAYTRWNEAWMLRALSELAVTAGETAAKSGQASN